MKLYWDESLADIGHYSLFFEDDNNEVLRRVSLVDYEGYEGKSKPNYLNEKTRFIMSYCAGFSHEEGFDSDISLEEAKKKCEDYIMKLVNNSLERAKESVAALTPQAKWLQTYQMQRDKCDSCKFNQNNDCQKKDSSCYSNKLKWEAESSNAE